MQQHQLQQHNTNTMDSSSNNKENIANASKQEYRSWRDWIGNGIECMLLMFLFFSTNFYQNVFACIRFCFFTPISLVLLLLFRTFCKLHLSALFLLFLFSFFPTISMWPSIHLFRQSVRTPRLHWVISRTKNVPQWFVLNVGLCKRFRQDAT